MKYMYKARLATDAEKSKYVEPDSENLSISLVQLSPSFNSLVKQNGNIFFLDSRLFNDDDTADGFVDSPKRALEAANVNNSKAGNK